MAYVPDPENVLTPLDSDVIGNVTPPEIRAIKQHIIDKFGELKALLQTYNDTITQQQTNIATSLNGNLADVTALIPSKLDPHIADTENPHGTTKAQLNLDKVNNWSASSDVDLDSTTTYATAAAVKTLMDSVTALSSSVAAEKNRRTTLINAANAAKEAGDSSKTFQNALNNVPKNLMYLVTRFSSWNESWQNNTGATAIVIEVRKTSTTNSNIVHVIPTNGTYNYVATNNYYAFVLGMYV